MEKTCRKILVLNPHQGFSGASVLLVTFLEWLKANSNIEFTLLFLQDGDKGLADRFAATGKCYTWEHEIKPGIRTALINKFTGRNQEKCQQKLIGLFKQEKFDLILSNNSTNTRMLEPVAAALSLPVITIEHSSHFALKRWNHSGLISKSVALTDRFIAVSNWVKRTLTQDFNIAAEKIDVIHGFISEYQKVSSSREKIRKELNVPDDALLVYCNGNRQWTKGVDLFAPVVEAVTHLKTQREIFFLWLGGRQGDEYLDSLEFDLEQRKLQAYARTMRHVSNPIDYAAAADVFLSLSREDSFPLALLEAGYLKQPAIVFDGSGGATEIIKDNENGYIVPMFDLEAVAEKIVSLAESPGLLKELGKSFHSEVVSSYTVESAANKILTTIEKCLLP